MNEMKKRLIALLWGINLTNSDIPLDSFEKAAFSSEATNSIYTNNAGNIEMKIDVTLDMKKIDFLTTICKHIGISYKINPSASCYTECYYIEFIG